jgi:4a-hydroxytetrahydrobiopterin dehydratase
LAAAVAPEPLTATRFAALDGLADWRYLLESIHATFRTGSYPAAVALIGAVAAQAGDHRLDVDLRHPGTVHMALGTAGPVSGADADLARTISRLAAAAGAVAEPTGARSVELAIDAMDIAAVRPFWRAVLGYLDVDGYLVDPQRRGPPLWFQQMDAPRAQRNRIHLDVTVPHDVAAERVAAALAAGGTLVSAARARAWWVLADPEGNEACVCTWQDRD